jgi:parvulin-like peptidyl-prolyl isomerase
VTTGLLSACQNRGVLVGKVGKTNIMSKDVDTFANFLLLANGYTRADITDQDQMKSLMTSSLDNVVTLEVVMQKAKEMGVYPLSEEDQNAVNDQVNGYLDQLKSQFQPDAESKAATDKSVDVDKEVQKMIDDKMKQDGLTVADMTKIMTEFKVSDLLEAQVNKDVAVTDADLQSKYDELVAQQKTDFDSDAAAYESARDGGETIAYVPAGFRYVKHILIAFSTDDSSAISTARSGGDDANANKLRDDALAKIKTKADEVLAKAKAGDDFDKLIDQYGEDPGMKEDPTKTTGYEIGASSSFVEEFRDAAMKLAKVGDISDLVGTDFGYHIIKYVSDKTPGPVALDSVKDALKETVLADKQNSNWETTIDGWKTAIGVTTYPEKLNTTVPTPAPAATTPVPAAS